MLQPDYDYLFHLLMGLGEYEHQLPIDHILCLGNSSQSDKAVQDHNLVYLITFFQPERAFLPDPDQFLRDHLYFRFPVGDPVRKAGDRPDAPEAL